MATEPTTRDEAEPAAPKASEQPTVDSGPVRTSRPSLFNVSTGGVWSFLGRWALPLFLVLVVIIARDVLLPFVFAGLIAFILAPIVRWMSERKDGTRRMPRGLAIIVCYLVFIAGVVGFLFLLVPRLAKDLQRIGKEAPSVYKQANEEWTPELAHWLEHRFPSLRPKKAEVEAAPIVPDVPLPPGTAFTVTPLPDGRMAVQLTGGGIDIKPMSGGGMLLTATETTPEPKTLEETLRTFFGKSITGMQSKINDVVKFGQSLIAALVGGIFTFFITLMIGAFILIDMEKVHSFLRSLFPPNARADYDYIIEGIDRGLSGVIRGQLLICLINGVLTYVGLRIFGIKYAPLLSMVAAAMSLIPIFGSILSTVPIVLASLVSGDTGIDVVRPVAMVAWILGIHFIEANILNPKIIGSSAKIHPVLVIFSLILGERTYGLVGALLAVPLLSAIQVIFLFFYKKAWKEPGAPRRAGADSSTQP